MDTFFGPPCMIVSVCGASLVLPIRLQHTQHLTTFLSPNKNKTMAYQQPVLICKGYTVA